MHTLVNSLKSVGTETSTSNPLHLSSPSPAVESSPSMCDSAVDPPRVETLSSTEQPTSLDASMYHSAFGTLPGEPRSDHDELEMTGSSPSLTSPLDKRRFSTDSRKNSSEKVNDVLIDWEHHSQRAGVKKLSAKLSINEASLTISSLGRTITEISVPGVKLEFLKRPYDSFTRFLVEDLCIVDRIQTFGPEYELVVCSSGRSLLGFSPLNSSLSPSSLSELSMEAAGFEKRIQSCPNFTSITSKNVLKVQPNSNSDGFESESEVVRGKTLERVASLDLLSPSRDEEMPGGALCALTYTQISPLSPEHPAMKDLGAQEVNMETLDGEPNIHRISLQCTAVDAIGKVKGQG